jgi:hypothetical protein
MAAYLDWLRAHVKTPVICILPEQYGAHDRGEVHRTANSLSNELIFVPDGGTAK